MLFAVRNEQTCWNGWLLFFSSAIRLWQCWSGGEWIAHGGKSLWQHSLGGDSISSVKDNAAMNPCRSRLGCRTACWGVCVGVQNVSITGNLFSCSVVVREHYPFFEENLDLRVWLWFNLVVLDMKLEMDLANLWFRKNWFRRDSAGEIFVSIKCVLLLSRDIMSTANVEPHAVSASVVLF